jgi:hypothetical protein
MSLADPQLQRRNRRLLCEVDQCFRKHYGRGMCHLHYQRWRANGTTESSVNRKAKPEKLCSIDGCEDVYWRRGWCSSHWHRWQRYGDPMLGGKRRQKVAPDKCTVEGCDRVHAADGYCISHYQRVRSHGDSLADVPFKVRNPAGTPYINGHGYVMIMGKLEHRLIMERLLGRPLAPYENVHHINGVRSDNRLENLELWTKPQPCGQRPSDLADWVVDHYPELVEAALARRTQLKLIA